MRAYHFFKRIFDVIVSFIGLIMLIPIFIFLAVFIKLTSKGPVVYKHTRIGKNGKEFNVYKFRSMIVNAREQQNKGVPDEKLITTAGKFMRKTFLDETLQLLNIFKGDISFIGPRPFDKESYSMLVKKNPGWEKIFMTKPGLTCLDSVVEYVPENEKEKFANLFGITKKTVNMEKSYKQGFLLDKYYTENESFSLDFKLFFYTFFLMIKKILFLK